MTSHGLKLNFVKTSKAFKEPASSYSIEAIDSKDPLVQLMTYYLKLKALNIKQN